MPFEGDPRTSTSAWRRLRRQVLERDDWRCTWMENGRRCEAEAEEVDHIVPVKPGGGDDELGNLRSLCKPHHERKTSAEGNAARWRHKRRREPPPHPGLI